MSQAASPLAPEQPRQLALLALQSVYRGAYADVAVHQTLRRGTLSDKNRGLFTELVYGCVRRRRTLEALIQQFVKKPPPPPLQPLLQLGLYQLRYLNHIPPSAAVHTTVELAKQNGLGGLAGLVNGVLRRYLRASETTDALQLPSDPIQRIGTLHSFPDWIVQVWVEQFGEAEADALCQWMNQPPTIDLRVNPLTASVTEMQAEMAAAGVAVEVLEAASQALRLTPHVGAIDRLPGFAEGKWMVQDASAQLVGQLMAPQPGDLVIDGCAAPGGKATHLAELMGDRGTVWACDRNAKRLRKVEENAQRLQLQSIRTLATDSRQLAQFVGQADRVLLDVPCSGLGTLHRHADARWRQTPASIEELSALQSELLAQGATWVKPGGRLVYATCTLHPRENEAIIQPFLKNQPDWCIEKPDAAWAFPFLNPAGWLQVLPHHHQMDGFFMVCLRHQG
ncbi:16S rRNA (cytosine(967)-C(5))-methyltransferase [Vacuolonema iberomarrocanum]|uniref:16S rRNA (cytosine(967)-C(5))-methyltransferase n=1 Tax=Vacuolonema iberomarrocanum TaxID=3454632 RepID=UPI0019E966B0|nr:16S rRNA (cytosine(967)-C(5))-methyltransferase [filamentous cyanobacterium LEGE 07170]